MHGAGCAFLMGGISLIVRSKQHLEPNGLPPPEMLASVIAEHTHQLPRLQKLKSYYLGNNAINSRARDHGLPNNKIAHPYARYIVAVSSGYLVGQPVAYSMPNESDVLNLIVDSYRRISASSIDTENARNAAIYGKGVEYIYLDASANPRAAALSPEHAFVVYSDSYDVEPLFGVYRSPIVKPDGSASGERVWVMSPAAIAEYTSIAASNLSQVSVKAHFFGGVPLVEYWNDESERGDFEWIIPLIDAYDVLQSDRINDKEQFVNALLILKGCTLTEDKRHRSPVQQLREDHMLSVPDNECDAKYLTNSLDESGTEIVRASLVEEIHKLSMIPNLSDKDFAANASGVAMRYKLWGLEQLTNVKKQWFAEGLRQRLKLFANFLAVRGSGTVDVADIKITFTNALPANELEQAQIAQLAHAAGAASREERIRILHKGDDWTEDDVAKESQRILTENSMPGPDENDPIFGSMERSVPDEAPEDEVAGE